TSAASSAFVSVRILPSSPSHATAPPSGSRLARGRVAATAWLNAPPPHQRGHSGPRVASSVNSGSRCQSSARSPTAADQNHAASSTARAWSVSRSGTRFARSRPASRESARSSGEGRQAASGTSRPKIGDRAIVIGSRIPPAAGGGGLLARPACPGHGPTCDVVAHLVLRATVLHGAPAPAPVLALVDEQEAARRAPLDPVAGAVGQQRQGGVDDRPERPTEVLGLSPAPLVLAVRRSDPTVGEGIGGVALQTQEVLRGWRPFVGDCIEETMEVRPRLD